MTDKIKGFFCFACQKGGLTYAEVCEHGKRHAKEELTKDAIVAGY